MPDIKLCKVCGRNCEKLENEWYCLEHGKQIFDEEEFINE